MVIWADFQAFFRKRLQDRNFIEFLAENRYYDPIIIGARLVGFGRGHMLFGRDL